MKQTCSFLKAIPAFAFVILSGWLLPTVAEAAETNKVSLTATNYVFDSKMAALDDVNPLAIGDRINLRILEDEEEPKPATVMQSGGVEVPYLGRFHALGKTCKQLSLELKAELEKEYFYRATVLIALDELGRSRGKVYLVGAVRTAGPQDIPGDETFTLSKAIVRAGGFAEYADKKRVKVTRKPASGDKDSGNFVINLVDVLEKGKAEKDLLLLPGDVIFVPDRIVSF